MSTQSFKDSEQYQKMPMFQRLWVDLSIATNTIRQGEDGDIVVARRNIPPWESGDVEVTKAWRALTSPENLGDLLDRLDPQMNSMARSYTERAIEECRERKKINVEQND